MQLSLTLSQSEINKYFTLWLGKWLAQHPESRGKVQEALPRNGELIQLSSGWAKVNVRGGAGKVSFDIGLTLAIRPERSGTVIQVRIVDTETAGRGFLNTVGALFAQGLVRSRVIELAREALADKEGFEVTDDSVIIGVCTLAARHGIEIGGVKAVNIGEGRITLEVG